MANAENRPFSGTWTYNNKKSRRHVPDCIVTFNGETAMPSCTGCVGQIDLQDLITSVSVTNATDTSPASVSLGMELPSNRRSCFFRDNKFILHPGIEIHVYMRGYFTHTELGSSAETDETYDLSKATMKPYYQVFNGVITDVSHGFSGGFYSVSMSHRVMVTLGVTIGCFLTSQILGLNPTSSKRVSGRSRDIIGNRGFNNRWGN